MMPSNEELYIAELETRIANLEAALLVAHGESGLTNTNEPRDEVAKIAAELPKRREDMIRSIRPPR